MVKKRCSSKTKEGKVCKNNKCMDSVFCGIHKPKEECTICLEYYKRPKRLNCFHKFCSECISRWIYLSFNDTCPLCRNEVTTGEVMDSFEYCFNNKIITKVLYFEFHLSNQELINYVQTMLADNIDYTYDEWQEFIRLILLQEGLYTKLYSSYTISYHHFRRFDENNPGRIENGRSILYNYRIVIDEN